MIGAHAQPALPQQLQKQTHTVFSQPKEDSETTTNLAHFDCKDKTQSAVAAMGMLLQHHRIGWNHVQKNEDGTPENDSFMATVAGWLSHASQCSAEHLLHSLQRAGLQPQGFSSGCSRTLTSLLCKELSEKRPVLAATLSDNTQNEPHTLWRVLYHINPNNHSIHTHNPFDAKQRLIWSTEEWLHKLTGQSSTGTNMLSYMVITACKPPTQPRLFIAKL